MKRVHILLVAVAVAALASGALAAMKGSADVVAAKARPSALSAGGGEAVQFTVDLDIADHWHLYAHGDSNFIGVDLVPAEDFPLEGFVAEYPEGKLGEFFGEKVRMIEGAQTITAAALVPEGLAAGEHELKLSVTVQACDDEVCLAPAKLPVKLTLTVE